MEPGHPDLEHDFLATVFHVVRTGICIIDERGCFVRVNPAFCELVGFEPDELIGHHYTMAAPESVIAVAEKFLLAAFADSPKIPREWKIRRRDGALFDALVSFKAIVRPDQKRFLIVTFSDITEAKRKEEYTEELNRTLEERIAERTAEYAQKVSALEQAEAALRENQERTRLVIDAAHDAVVTMDDAGFIIAWNRSAEVIFGWRHDQAMGHRLSELIIPERLRAAHEQGIKRFLATGERRVLNRTLEVPLKRKDGSEIPVELSVWPVKSGERYIFGSFIRDISERKRAEEEARVRSAKLLQYRDRMVELAAARQSRFRKYAAAYLGGRCADARVERVSFRRLADDRSAIRCEMLYRASRAAADIGAEGYSLFAQDYPSYFAAITTDRPVVANDARQHADTREFAASYLEPNGIASMLDTAVWFHGQVVGVICHEHVGPMRDWTVEEVDFATAIANMVSLALEASSRAQAQSERKQSEQKYQRVINQTREGFWLMNAADQTLEANDALCEMLGYTMAELSGQTPYQFVAAESRGVLTQALATCDHSSSGSYEIVFTAKDGRKVPTIFNATRAVNDRGVSELSFAFLNDITDLRRLQESLQQTLRERELILENSVVGIAFLKERRILWINNRLEQQMFGYSPGELVGELSEVCYPTRQAYEELGEVAYPLLAQGCLYEGERLMKRKDGTLFWCCISGRAVDPADLAAGSIWVVSDVTERKRLEENLQQTLAEREAILETTVVGILVTENRVVKWLNTAMAEILGYTREQTIGQTLEKTHVSRAAYEEFGREAYSKLQHGETHAKERQFKHKDGSIRWLAISGRAVDPDNAMGRAIWVGQDITERKRLQEELKQTLAEREAILETSSVGILLIEERQVKWLNSAMARMGGYSKQELIGRSTEIGYASKRLTSG